MALVQYTGVGLYKDQAVHFIMSRQFIAMISSWYHHLKIVAIELLLFFKCFRESCSPINSYSSRLHL